MKKLIIKHKIKKKINKKKLICCLLIPIVIIMALFTCGMTINYKQKIANSELNNTIVAEQVIEIPKNEIADKVIEQQIIEEIPQQIEKTIVYTTTSVNLRSAPGLHGEIIKVLSINTELTKVGEENGWSIIETEDGQYYIKSTYISTEKTKVVQKQTTTSRGGNTSTTTKTEKGNLTYLGYYKLTHYCSCSKCCGKSNGITASGKKVQEGITVACNSLPLGTKISINGHIYEVQDRGGMKSNVIDIYVDGHQKALNLGVKYADVYIVK